VDTPDAPLRLLLVAHGYPPREAAGTEQHVALLARELHAQGHRVEVLAATRDPARRQYASWTEADPEGFPVHRLVDNLPARALAQAERDRAVEAVARRVEARLQPHLVHLHHLQFLSSGLRFACPTVLTLHDQWLWCAAGGLGLLPDGAACPGPTPDRCAPCAAAWQPVPRPAARLLLSTAGRLAGRVPPAALHGALRWLPSPVRRQLQAPIRGRPAEPAAAAAARNAALAALARSCALRLAPSQHLATLATAQGLGPVEVLGNGVPAGGPRAAEARDGPFLFLGTIAAHKGPDLVLRAWQRAFPAGQPALRMHGPVQYPGLVPAARLGGPLDRAGVAQALAGARALVLGSRWPENAPLVVLEARAAGCPVVAPACGGLPELVQEGVDGWLYPPGDEAALARILQRVVTAPLSRPPRPPPTARDQARALLRHYRRVLGQA